MKKSNGFTVIEGLLILVIAGILGGTGWYVTEASNNTAKTLNNAGSTSYLSPVATKTTNLTKPTSPSANPYAGWKDFCLKAEGCFKYPSNWTVKQTTDAGGIVTVSISSPSGTQILWDTQLQGLGGGCDPSTHPHIYIHEVNALSGAAGLYEISIGGQASANSYAIVDNSFLGTDKTPTVGDTGACLVYFTFKDKSGYINSFSTGVQSNVETSLKSGDESMVKKILLSYHN